MIHCHSRNTEMCDCHRMTNDIHLVHICSSLWHRLFIECIFPWTNTPNFSIIQTSCTGKLISASESTQLLPTSLLYFGSSKWPWKILVSYYSRMKGLDFFFSFLFVENFTNVTVCWIGPVWFSVVVIQNKREVALSPAWLITEVSK